MESIDKNLTDFSYLTQFFCMFIFRILLLKRLVGQNQFALSPNPFMYVCVHKGIHVGMQALSLTDIWLSMVKRALCFVRTRKYQDPFFFLYYFPFFMSPPLYCILPMQD